MLIIFHNTLNVVIKLAFENTKKKTLNLRPSELRIASISDSLH